MSKKLPNISIEKFAAYLDNNLPENEMAMLDNVINTDEAMSSIISLNNQIDNYSIENATELPTEILTNSYEIPNIDSETNEAIIDAVNSFDNFFHNEGDSLNEDLGSLFHENNIDEHLLGNIMDTNGTINGYYGEINPILQQYSDTCAIKAQQLILNEFNIPCTEDELVQYSIEHGWYDGHGTSMDDVGKLLIDGGVPCTQQSNANAFDLMNELAQGHKIIVGVDSAELVKNDTLLDKLSNWFNDFFNGNTPDHALIVAGIDTTDPNNIQVIVTDPGTGDYHKAYPIEQFMDAWSDSECFMVSTDVSVPETSPQMANFDYSTGHIEDVGGVDYSEFQVFNDMSHGIPCNYMDWNGQIFNPMNSFTNAYFDYAHNPGMMFSDIFNHDQYMFNDFMNPNIITPQFQNTFDFGMNQINFTPDNDWNHYAMMHDIPMMTNYDYGNFLDQSIMNFQMMGDYNSMAFCEQQHMMLDYCNFNGFDFSEMFF